MKILKYNGVSLEVPTESPVFRHSILLETDKNTPYFSQLIQYKQTNLPDGDLMHEVCALYSISNLNYQTCNGGFRQYYGNAYHEYRAGYNIGDLPNLDIDEQIVFLKSLISFILLDESKKRYEDDLVQVCSMLEVLSQNIVEYESMDELEQEICEIAGCDEFDKQWYKVNEIIEWGMELYAQYLIKRLHPCYTKGMKLRLTKPINDRFTPKDAGDIFTVDYVDDAGQIHGSWQSGGSMALITGVDEFEII